jgi:hypothetical protein
VPEVSRRVVTFHHVDPRLGRHLVHDDRSRKFALSTAPLPKVPVLHDRAIPILNQGDLGSCTANAQLGMLASGPFPALLKARGIDVTRWTEDDAVSLYEQETSLDDREIPGRYPPEDTGSAGLYACQASRARGWISGYRHAFTTPTALGWLGRQPISIGIPWFNSMFEPDPRSHIVAVNRRSGIAGGHQVCLDGIDPKWSMVRLANSWGTSWGDHGRAWLSFSDLRYLLSQGGDAVTAVVAA